MKSSLDQLILDLKKFDDRKTLVKELRKEIRKPVPSVRKAIRQRALGTLPRRGGLNKWVASTRITAQVKVNTRQVTVRLKGGRNSLNSRSDIKRIDAGRVRAPTFGRRGKGQWHSQEVEKGFFTQPTIETWLWRHAILRAVDNALDVIKRGGK